MSQRKQRINSINQSFRADFTLSDLITTLVLIAKEPMGRYKLQDELARTESSTKSLLNFCKKEGLLQSSVGRKGHSLDKKGQEITKVIFSRILSFGKLEHNLFPSKEHFYTYFIKDTELTNEKQHFASWKIRDLAVVNGAEAILLLEIDEKKDFDFPEKNLDMAAFYPQLQDYLEKELDSIEANRMVLITAAETLQKARKAGLLTTLQVIPQVLTDIITTIES